MTEYKFIEEPKKQEKPVFLKKKTLSISERIVNEFLESGLDKAIVKKPDNKSIRDMNYHYWKLEISKVLKKRKLPYVCKIDNTMRLWIYGKDFLK